MENLLCTPVPCDSGETFSSSIVVERISIQIWLVTAALPSKEALLFTMIHLYQNSQVPHVLPKLTIFNHLFFTNWMAKRSSASFYIILIMCKGFLFCYISSIFSD